MPQKHKHNSTPSKPDSALGPDGQPLPWLAVIYRDKSVKYGVPYELLVEQGRQENQRFSQFGISKSGAAGPAQFMPGTARDMGLKVTGNKATDERFDYQKSIDAQARLMSRLLKDNQGRIDLALAAYNAGQGNVKHYEKIDETRKYVNQILERTGYKKGQTIDVNQLRGPEKPAPSKAPTRANKPVSELAPTQPPTPELAAPTQTRVVARMGR